MRYVDQDFRKFDTVRTLLLGQFELYVKYIHKSIGREPQKTLKPCLTEVFNEFSYLQEGSDKYNEFWAKNAIDKTPTYSPEYFQHIFPLGKEFKLTYDLRNSIIHNSRLYGGQTPSVKNLPSDIGAINRPNQMTGIKPIINIFLSFIYILPWEHSFLIRSFKNF